MRSVPENIWLPEEMFPKFPGVQGASLSTLNSPQGELKVCSCSNRGFSLCRDRRKMPLLLFSSVQSLSRVRLFATPGITARQASLSITNSRSSLKLMSIESVMPSSHLILCRPFSSCPQSLPASESFPMSQLFA